MTNLALQRAREQKALKRLRVMERVHKMNEAKRMRTSSSAPSGNRFHRIQPEPYIVITTSKTTDLYAVSPQHEIDKCLYQQSPPPAPREIKSACPDSNNHEITEVSPRAFHESDCYSTEPCYSVSYTETLSMNVSTITEDSSRVSLQVTAAPLSLRIPETIELYSNPSPEQLLLLPKLSTGAASASSMFISPLSDDDEEYGHDRVRSSALVVPVSLPSFDELTIVSQEAKKLVTSSKEDEYVQVNDMSVD